MEGPRWRPVVRTQSLVALNLGLFQGQRPVRGFSEGVQISLFICKMVKIMGIEAHVGVSAGVFGS